MNGCVANGGVCQTIASKRANGNKKQNENMKQRGVAAAAAAVRLFSPTQMH